ncbi:MAG: hypothetical protein BGO49_28490 [Planctomycetales bacterium 71-10]|nr:MAG: hypothetical protein BGO49_28490 [Planctomycetales bacterium 71-10]
MKSHADEHRKSILKVAPTEEAPEGDDGCGISFRTPGQTLVVTADGGRVWHLKYIDMPSSPVSLTNPVVAAIPFAYDRDKFYLVLHGNPAHRGDAELGLGTILLQIAEGYRRTIYGGNDRVLKVEVRDAGGKVVGDKETPDWVGKLERA